MIFKLFSNLKKNIFLLIILSVIVSLLDILSIGLIIPLISIIFEFNNENLKYLFSFFQIENLKNTSLIIIISILMIIFFIIKNIFSYFIQKKIFNFCFNEQILLRKKIFDNYLSAPLEELLNKDFSVRISNLTEIVRKTTETFLMYFLKIISDSLIFLSILIFLFVFNFKITLSLLFFVSIVFLFFKYIYKTKIINYGKNIYLSFKDIISNADTAINAFKEIKIFQREEFLKDKLLLSSKNFASSQVKFLLSQIVPRYVIEVLFVIIILFSAILVFSFEKNLEEIMITLAIFSFVAIRIAPISNQLIVSFTQLWNSKYIVKEIVTELEYFESYKNQTKNIIDKKHTIKNNIKFKNFSFSYKDNIIFDNTDFEIVKNTFTTIKGPSGTGKTTLIHIFLGLLNIQSGKIIIDDQELVSKKINLIGNLSYIPQDTFLLNESVKENITFGSEFNQNLMKDVLDQVNLTSFVNKLPNNLDTIVGYKGGLLSGGQRQRISLARALYNKRKILVLDEPTTALDMQSIDLLKNTLKKIKGNYTIIIISHQSDFDSLSDNIYKIDNLKLIKN